MNIQLRTRLRTVNMEISALLREAATEVRDQRLAFLRRQRQHLMALLMSDGKLRMLAVPREEDFAGSVDITYLLPRANNGMSA